MKRTCRRGIAARFVRFSDRPAAHVQRPRRVQRGAIDARLGVQVPAVKQHDDRDRHRREPAEPQAGRRRAGKPGEAERAGDPDQAAQRDLGRRMDVEQQARGPDQRGAGGGGQQHRALAPGAQRDGEAAQDDRRGGGVPARAAQHGRRAGVGHELEREHQRERRPDHARPGERAAPPAGRRQGAGDGDHQRQDDGLIGEIGKQVGQVTPARKGMRS